MLTISGIAALFIVQHPNRLCLSFDDKKLYSVLGLTLRLRFGLATSASTLASIASNSGTGAVFQSRQAVAQFARAAQRIVQPMNEYPLQPFALNPAVLVQSEAYAL